MFPSQPEITQPICNNPKCVKLDGGHSGREFPLDFRDHEAQYLIASLLFLCLPNKELVKQFGLKPGTCTGKYVKSTEETAHGMRLE